MYLLGIVTETKIAAHDMLQQPDGLRLDELSNHIAERRPDGVEALIGMTDIRQARLVK